MRRADRLFQIVQYLRGGRLLTAKILSERLEVSERTIYRDIADLQGSGVPIDGEAGVGYILREGYEMPPLMFSKEEMSALLIGARIVNAWGGTRMALAAQEALVKINTVLPDEAKRKADQTPVFALDFHMPDRERKRLDQLDHAIQNRLLLNASYEDAIGNKSERELEPLGLYYWGKVWTLVAWCRKREDFRSFRTDRFKTIDILQENFKREKGKTLSDYLAKLVECEGLQYNPPGSV